MKEEEKINAGILFSPADPELKAMKLKAHRLNQDYNRLYEDETAARERILRTPARPASCTSCAATCAFPQPSW